MRFISRCGMLMLLGMLAVNIGSAQTDVGASIYGAFGGTTSGSNTTEIPANAAGGMLELRHKFNAVLGFEATYSYNRADQEYKDTFNGTPANLCPPGPGCPPPLPDSAAVSANAHEFTADWIPSKTTGTLRPFGVLGGGVLLTVPSGGQSNTRSVTEPVFVYGVGLDWARWKRIGLRLQYRGSLYNSPHMLTSFYYYLGPTNALMLTNEPMLGIYFRLP